MQYNLDQMIAVTEGKKAIMKKKTFVVEVEFGNDFSHTVTFPKDPPEEYREFLEDWADMQATAARRNAQEEGLPAEMAWDDYFQERLDSLKAAEARRQERGKEFKPPWTSKKPVR